MFLDGERATFGVIEPERSTFVTQPAGRVPTVAGEAGGTTTKHTKSTKNGIR